MTEKKSNVIGCGLTFSETLRALSISSFLVNESLGLHCRAPAFVTRPVQLKPSSPTCFLMWEPIWKQTETNQMNNMKTMENMELAWPVKCLSTDGDTAAFIYFIILCSHGCIFGLIRQVSKLIGQLVGQSSEVIGVGVRLGHLKRDEKTHWLSS